MFVAQAAAQFELWTGIRPDTQKMRQAVLARPDRQNQ
jgi:shikimate dehydrogenase